MTGAWKNVAELEDSITLGELNKIVEGIREQEERYIRSFAVIMGVELNDEPEEKKEQPKTAKDRIRDNLRKKRGEGSTTASLEEAKREAHELGFNLGLGYQEVKDNNN